MHPNTYLRTFWRTQFKPQVFVAMSFSDAFAQRFANVIEPAISSLTYHGEYLRAHRVDLSKSGDSILTDIIDGVAHSVMILADVSIIGHDSKTGASYRNANVMYEVGLALACRHSTEVLLIRDDKEPFLFDVSTVPHKHIDFADPKVAQSALAEELAGRLRAIDYIRDARVGIAIASLTAQERMVLAVFAPYPMGNTFWLRQTNAETMVAVPRLLDKQLIRTAGATDNGQAMFIWTELGRALADSLDSQVPMHKMSVLATAATQLASDKPFESGT